MKEVGCSFGNKEAVSRGKRPARQFRPRRKKKCPAPGGESLKNG